jgi:hypothetical protein
MLRCPLDADGHLGMSLGTSRTSRHGCRLNTELAIDALARLLHCVMYEDIQVIRNLMRRAQGYHSSREVRRHLSDISA